MSATAATLIALLGLSTLTASEVSVCFPLGPCPDVAPVAGSSHGLVSALSPAPSLQLTDPAANCHPQHIIDRAIDARDIQRRSVPSLGNATNNTLPSPLSASFVEGCVAYNCFCHSDTSGNPFDPDSGCFPKDCKFGRAQGETFECQCAWMGCDCDSQYLMQGTGMKCGECAPGMILYGNHCYMSEWNCRLASGFRESGTPALLPLRMQRVADPTACERG